MAECNHDCSHCSQNCSERTAIEKFVPCEGTEIKHIIGVVSGKGGVGKSFVTSLLAAELNRQGYSVGILDADITGPSIPKSFNIHESAYGDKEGKIIPAVTRTGIRIISSNLLLEHEDDPLIWRGSLINSLLSSFFKDVRWEKLDYLLIDMPPGTGDLTLTCFQQVPLDGIMMVTSPQDLVNMVVSKCVNMARTMNIRIFGLVENMSYLVCPHCGDRINLYGESKVDETAAKFNLPVLAKLPIIAGTSNCIDDGKAEFIQIPEIQGAVAELLKL